MGCDGSQADAQVCPDIFLVDPDIYAPAGLPEGDGVFVAIVIINRVLVNNIRPQLGDMILEIMGSMGAKGTEKLDIFFLDAAFQQDVQHGPGHPMGGGAPADVVEDDADPLFPPGQLGKGQRTNGVLQAASDIRVAQGQPAVAGERVIGDLPVLRQIQDQGRIALMGVVG